MRWVQGALITGFATLLACGEETTAPPSEAPPPPEIPAEATAWLNANLIPFDGSDPSLPMADLAFLNDLVGDASVVALGENTHGTRDFFEMKARIVRYLVEEMDFAGFAIEATWPEANRLDRYVREGVGDPHELLSGLYFWTWNTESVLEMIEWMRQHNQNGGDVGFYGFDMQYPGMALHNVLDFVAGVDPAALADFTALLQCLNDFANDPSGRFPQPGYDAQSPAYHTACGASLEEARLHLLVSRSAYEAAAGEEEFARALQSLRVARQYHEVAVQHGTRDEYMAENTLWLQERLGGSGRLVLWAHNFHVSALSGAQGSFLRGELGDDLLIVGFSHVNGSFTGVRQQGSRFFGTTTLALDAPRSLSYEHYLSTGFSPSFALDLRRRDPADPGGAWLAGPRAFRSIGCCYDPDQPARYWASQPVPQYYDVLIHFDVTRPTTLLPFTPPAGF